MGLLCSELSLLCSECFADCLLIARELGVEAETVVEHLATSLLCQKLSLLCSKLSFLCSGCFADCLLIARELGVDAEIVEPGG